MSKANTSTFTIVAAIAIMVVTGCQSVRTNRQSAAEPTATIKVSAAESGKTAVAAAQTSTESQPFSASETYRQAALASPQDASEAVAANTAADSKAAFATLREKIQQKQGQMSGVKRMAVNSALKKLEKMQAKKEIRKVEAAKKANASGEYRTPIILGIVGLVVLIIGAIAYVPILYILGSLALTAAIIWAILILAEVI